MSARIAEASALSPSSFRKSEGDELREEDTKEDEEDESSDADDEKEGYGLDDKGQGLDDEGQGLDDEFSPSSPIVPSPVALPVATPVATISVDEDQFLEVGAQLELHGSILYDHTQRLDALPLTLFEGYDKDLRELYSRSGVVRDEIFSQRYRFRSLKQEQERDTVTFRAIWRPVLALEAYAGQTDAERIALWHAIYDIKRENHDLRRQLAEERHERLNLTDRVARIERRQEFGEE
ncbi:hypothetical protein Tco_1202730 [Tanacetum coccineum]